MPENAQVRYHPDPEIDEGRGHFLTIGAHRCLGCGYVGTGGVMSGDDDG